jgi:predicted lipid carrier protein YhbT
MEMLDKKLATRAEAAQGIDAVYKFVLSGEGGGTWTVSLKDGALGVSETDSPAECTIGLAAKDFVDMFEGKANGQQLFFAGKLNVSGDMQLALKLKQLTELLQG